jgi:hypothetical protein
MGVEATKGVGLTTDVIGACVTVGIWDVVVKICVEFTKGILTAEAFIFLYINLSFIIIYLINYFKLFK